MSRPVSPLDDVSSIIISDIDDQDYPTDYTTPSSIDSLHEEVCTDEVEEFRDREYPQLKGKTYLDHGGTTLYAKSLMEQFSADMISNLYGNPHSASTPSAFAGHRIDAIRYRALRFFNADPEDWDLVFTANATASIKLVMECFRDHAATSNTPVWYGYHKDSHTSVVGAREATKTHRCFASDQEVDTWINSGGLGGPRARQLGLFAYPGQSNMTGRRLPTSWPGRIRKTFHKAATYTLLDAAALASTAVLDLGNTSTAPDFVALSFYKIFGFPNVGALLVQKQSQHVLKDRAYFGGGTVDMVIDINDAWHAKKGSSLHDRLEDGTLPFHSIIALDHAMDVHERLYGVNPMKFISMHTARLSKLMYEGLAGLKHRNGAAVARIYKDDQTVYGDPTVQGATIALNVMRADGTMVGYADVEEAADDRNIYVRSGSLCNPGGVASYLNWTPAEMRAAFQAGHRCSHPTQVMFGKATGVVRVSMGAMSTIADVDAFLDFIRDTYLDTVSAGLIATPSAQTSASQSDMTRSGAMTPDLGQARNALTTSSSNYSRSTSRMSSRGPSILSPRATSFASRGTDTTTTALPSAPHDRNDVASPSPPASDTRSSDRSSRNGQLKGVADVSHVVRQSHQKGTLQGGGSGLSSSMEIKVHEHSRRHGDANSVNSSSNRRHGDGSSVTSSKEDEKIQRIQANMMAAGLLPAPLPPKVGGSVKSRKGLGLRGFLHRRGHEQQQNASSPGVG
ncbi:hypothetical protein AAFC00_004305 [Neodothiora populina]|uniref:Aminotransferase class V domain-containing protein n=1 Tax=Neodothiora populina TaxID=2781224 RepID=A0ABR3PJ99_9PEZI